MTITALMTALRSRLGTADVTISWLDKRDGSQVAAAQVGGRLFATWKGRIVNPQKHDGITPRGPKDYHSLQFFDNADGTN